MEITIQLPDVKLGVLQAQAPGVGPAGEELSRLMEEICSRKRRDFTLETLAEAEPTRAVRAMFRAWDMDPSKYRPASEALLRRVVQGKGLYHVSSVVDIGNLASIETGWPLGCYDRSKIRAPIVFRHGSAGEHYEGIGKRTWHLESRPVLADSDGPFGSPISDSIRSMITEAARDVMVVMYVPAAASDASIKVAMALLGERLARFVGAAIVGSDVWPAMGV
jgi:DNA/RNA-binding domain of Phe-tRNA-synthetase-like protein